MKSSWRGLVLGAMGLLAAASALGAANTLQLRRDAALPREIYERMRAGEREARFTLRVREGYVIVCPKDRSEAIDVTDIETAALREADLALLRKGIPAADRESVLRLLEDLGS